MRLSVQAEEEARSLQKKIQLIENDLDQTLEQLMQVNAKLDEKDKALQNVSFMHVMHLYSLVCP
jgi:choline dehydrogenase-like flavoprotein